MNERMLELYRQAWVPHTAIDPSNLMPYETTTFSAEKFAELIVRECVNEIEFQYGGGSDQPMDSEWDRAIECASSMVKYRFGVE